MFKITFSNNTKSIVKKVAYNKTKTVFKVVFSNNSKLSSLTIILITGGF